MKDSKDPGIEQKILRISLVIILIITLAKVVFIEAKSLYEMFK